MASRLNDNIAPTVTLAEGFPVHNPSASVQLRRHGGGGLGLLQDTQLIESLAHFARERIPERVVHAKAAGAWGEFEVTHDVSKLTSAKFLEQVGKKTPVFARLSTVAGERGSADTLADIRGFAVKFYTEEGNYDIVGNDLPVFFIRDPVKFPSLNRSHKRHPRTNAGDNNMFWDFHNNAPESIHTLMQLFGGRGTPQSLRYVNGFANHTFKFGHPDGDFVYVKIHFKPPGGVKNMDPEEAMRLAGVNPDYHVLDLYNAIQEGDFPTWIMYIQVMTPQQAEQAGSIVFDITKVWPHKDYPLQQVGKLTLNKNPENYFAEVEQAAFSPSTLVPGISPSPDIMLHARMFSYPDAQRYRVGPNYQQLPVNTPRCPVYAPYERDGAATVNKNYGGDPVYVGSRFRSIVPGPKDMRHEEWAGRVQDYASEFDPVEDVRQPRELWTLMKKNGDDIRLVNNLASHIGRAVPELQQGAIEMFSLVDKELSDRIAHQIKEQGTGKSQ